MPHGIYPEGLAAAFKGHAGEKWRPSNNTEGEVFIGSWCCQCAGMDLCKILTATCAFGEDDPEYPVEWQIGTDGQPVCTAFHRPGEPIPTQRCDQTRDLFEEPNNG